jgi:hypothetical protein
MPAKHNGVSVVEISGNSKVGKVSATYASQVTCPESCALKGSGCYAESGMVGMQTRRLNREADDHQSTVQELAELEAAGIHELTGRFPLRLHVVGDCTTDSAARTVSLAADEHRTKFGSAVWGYTHAWREVARASWGNVSILASCEAMPDARVAMKKGYAAAVVVAEHRSAVAWRDEETGLRVIPCPEQTGKSASCEKCQLCWNGGRLRANNSVIAFEAHAGKKKVIEKLRLVQIGGPK